MIKKQKRGSMHGSTEIASVFPLLVKHIFSQCTAWLVRFFSNVSPAHQLRAPSVASGISVFIGWQPRKKWNLVEGAFQPIFSSRSVGGTCGIRGSSRGAWLCCAERGLDRFGLRGVSGSQQILCRAITQDSWFEQWVGSVEQHGTAFL